MPSPYANPYGSLTKVNVRGPSAAQQAQDKKKSNDADLMRMIGQWAPVAGTALGGVVGGLAGGGAGAVPGMAIGGSLGGLAGSMLNSGADAQTRDAEEADLARRRKLAALQQVSSLLR